MSLSLCLGLLFLERCSSQTVLALETLCREGGGRVELPPSPSLLHYSGPGLGTCHLHLEPPKVPAHVHQQLCSCTCLLHLHLSLPPAPGATPGPGPLPVHMDPGHPGDSTVWHRLHTVWEVSIQSPSRLWFNITQLPTTCARGRLLALRPSTLNPFLGHKE